MTLAPNPTVLIVEDDPGIAELEQLRLGDAGYRTLVASTADTALIAIRRGGIDLVLLDFRLPDEIDGLEFYARIKMEGLDPPVILVTGFGNEATVIRALRAGVRDFVTKSAEFLDYLPEAVGHVLRQVRTEIQLAESETRLASVIASAKDAIIIAESDHTISLFNPAAERMFHCKEADALGKPLDRFFPPTCSAPIGSSSASVSVIKTREQGVRLNGETFPLEASVARAEVGGRALYTIVARDITERRRADARLREQAALLDRATDAILVLDLGGRVRYWNHGAERLYGWTSAEAVGRSVSSLYAAGRDGEQEAAAKSVLANGEWAGELAHVTRLRKEVYVAGRWSLVRDDRDQPYAVLLIHTDVTEKRALEARLRQTVKMEAIGRLAGGVAHDFNNLLTVIQGYSEMLLGGTALEPANRELVAEVYRAGEKAAGLTRQLLAFSRQQMLAPRVVDLNGLVREMEKMLRRLIGADIDLAATLDPNLGSVRADPGQLEQVVMNLAVNARDAMPKGGRLTIETRNVDLHKSQVQPGVKPGPYLLLAVTDTGIGMDAATKAKIFEPFFTTKETGKGTGLGLATVHGIVQQSGGHLEVYSELGRGSSFKVYLPRLLDGGDALPIPTATTAVPEGVETVLIVEDDPGIRSLARIALQSYGYTVLEAADGHEGLQVGLNHAGPIHLLTTDVVLPRLSGREVAEQLRAARPDLKVLYVSGYTDDAVVRHGVLSADAAFLQKPFTPSTLARKVREVLNSDIRND
jgi:two-component system, cell cycle sensor histidine kinase and response regulator CckA